MGTDSQLDHTFRGGRELARLRGLQALAPEVRKAPERPRDPKLEDFALEWQVADRRVPAV